MSNPMRWFRKYQNVMMWVFGILMIISFVFLGSMSGGFNVAEDSRFNAAGRGDQDIVVHWKHGQLSESDFDELRQSRNLMRRYTRLASEIASQRGGLANRVASIPDSDSDGVLLELVLLSNQAKEMGISIDDEACRIYLEQLTDNRLAGEEFPNIWYDITGGRLDREQLLDILRRELMAMQVRSMMQSGDHPISPVRLWDFYNRLERKVSAEILPIPVNAYLDKVREPSESELTALFEKYKNDYPQPDAPTPGFKQRTQAEFSYIKFDFDEFYEAELAAVTDEEIKQYYEEHKDEYRALTLLEDDLDVPDVPDSPADEDTPPAPPTDSTPSDESSQPATSEESDATESDATESDATESDATESDATESDATESDATDSESGSNDTVPAEPAGDASAEDAETTEGTDSAEGTETEAGSGPEESPAENESSRVLPSGHLRLLVQADDVAAEVNALETESDTPATTEETEEPTTTEQPKATEGNESAEEKPESNSTDTPDAVAPDAFGPKPDSSDTSPASEGETENAEPVKYQPLEKVESEIRRAIANPRAQAKLDTAFATAHGRCMKYYKKEVAWQAKKDDQAPKPEPPVVDDIPAPSQLKIESTPLCDAIEIEDHALGKAYDLQISQRGVSEIPFARIGFDESIMPYMPVEFPSRRGVAGGISSAPVHYLFWKTRVERERTPEFTEVREQVLAAWKNMEAYNLAIEAATELADKTEKAGTSLTAEESGRTVFEIKDVTWMTGGNVPMDTSSTPRPSMIPGVDAPGYDFYAALFSVPVGKTTATHDNPKNNAYVIRVTSESPALSVREAGFLANVTKLPGIHYILQNESQRSLARKYENLLESEEVTWNRAAMASDQQR